MFASCRLASMRAFVLAQNSVSALSFASNRARTFSIGSLGCSGFSVSFISYPSVSGSLGQLYSKAHTWRFPGVPLRYGPIFRRERSSQVQSQVVSRGLEHGFDAGKKR